MKGEGLVEELFLGCRDVLILLRIDAWNLTIVFIFLYITDDYHMSHAYLLDHHHIDDASHMHTTRTSKLCMILKAGAAYSKSYTFDIESFRTFTVLSIPYSI